MKDRSTSSWFGAFTRLFTPRSWVWAAVIVSVVVVGAIAWVHWEQTRTQDRTFSALQTVRQARVDLAKGFLYVSLARDPSEPFSREVGLALMQQAVVSFEDSLEQIGGAGVLSGSDSADPSRASLDSFRSSVDSFRTNLVGWAEVGTRDPAAEANLRRAFYDLENQADNIDAQVQVGLSAASARSNARFISVFGAAVLLLLAICVGLYIAGHAQDRTRAALRESESRWQYAIEGAGDGLWDWDMETGAVFYSPRWKSILGFDEHDLPDTYESWQERVHPGDWPRVERELNAHLEGDAPLYASEQRLRGKDGTYKWVLDRGKVISRAADGRPLRIIGTLTDISDRRRAEEDLLRLSTAIDQAAEGVVIADARGFIQYVNPGFEAISGYKREEISGSHIRVLGSGLHDDSVFEEMWRTLRSGQTWSGRLSNKRKNGSIYTSEMVISPVRDASGEMVNLVSVEHDVTGELELEAQRDEARRMEALGQLAGGVAHDLNNLLTPILGYGELLLAELPPEDPQRESVDEICGAALRAGALVKKLLAFGRRQALETKPVDLNEVIADFMKLLRRIIRENVHIEFSSAPGLPAILADVGQMEQVITNLAVNAQDAMPGGGTLAIETGLTEVDEALQARLPGLSRGRHVFLTVTDTGVGMDAQTIARIFEPFFTTKEKGRGTGLGLATVYGIVKQHQGDIWVYSEPGRGTTFKLYFPAVQAEAVPVPSDNLPAAATPGGSETILLAEDDRAVRGLTAEVLRRLGYTVLEAENGQEALTLLEAQDGPVHVLLSDLVMPGLNGRELFEEANRRLPTLKVLYMSGYAGDLDDELITAGGQANLIRKPFSLQALAVRIRETIDG